MTKRLIVRVSAVVLGVILGVTAVTFGVRVVSGSAQAARLVGITLMWIPAFAVFWPGPCGRFAGEAVRRMSESPHQE